MFFLGKNPNSFSIFVLILYDLISSDFSISILISYLVFLYQISQFLQQLFFDFDNQRYKFFLK